MLLKLEKKNYWQVHWYLPYIHHTYQQNFTVMPVLRILMQKQWDGKLKPVFYFSKRATPTESKIP